MRSLAEELEKDMQYARIRRTAFRPIDNSVCKLMGLLKKFQMFVVDIVSISTSTVALTRQSGSKSALAPCRPMLLFIVTLINDTSHDVPKRVHYLRAQNDTKSAKGTQRLTFEENDRSVRHQSEPALKTI